METQTLQSTSDTSYFAISILLIEVISIVAIWKIFVKAGQPGWYSLVPIVNGVILLRIARKPWWWLIASIIPLVGIYILFSWAFGFAHAFGKPKSFGLVLVFLPFIGFPLLAFGSSKYQRAHEGDSLIAQSHAVPLPPSLQP
jgi:hypothetical protein